MALPRDNEGPGTRLGGHPGPSLRSTALSPRSASSIAGIFSGVHFSGSRRLSVREDYRLFTCVRCHALVSICSACDRGQWYCGPDCSRQSRLEGVRAAGRRYQASRPGRHRHADRQARYRQRKRGEPLPGKVTHQGTPEGPEEATLPLATCQPEHSEGHAPVGRAWSVGAAGVVCFFCGAPCAPYARSGPLRRRRRARADSSGHASLRRQRLGAT